MTGYQRLVLAALAHIVRMLHTLCHQTHGGAYPHWEQTRTQHVVRRLRRAQIPMRKSRKSYARNPGMPPWRG